MPAGIPLPAGIEQLPDLGPDVVGTRPRQVWAIMVWFSVVLMLGLTVLFVFVALGPRASGAGPWIGVLICVAVTAALAWFATTIGKPILIIDSEAVRTLALIGKEAIPLRSITGLSMGVGGRSLLLDVAGAVQANAKPGKKKSIIISNIHTYRVAPGDLMNYIAARARASHQG